MSVRNVSNKLLSFVEWVPPRPAHVESKVARFAIKFFIMVY